jgi:HD-GYP domain-containing protein (c-di-GMP phosphodiesterase class II)
LAGQDGLSGVGDCGRGAGGLKMTEVQHDALESGTEAATGGNGADNEARLRRLIDLGIALSAERDHHRLIERILLEAKGLYDADGGTLYLLKNDALDFEIMRNDTMEIAMGGTTGVEIPFPPLPLYDAEGNPNHKNVASYVALAKETVNIADAYEVDRFDFSGAKKFDQSTGYRSKSFLTVPLTNYEGDVLGVLQLINARENGEVVPFDQERQALIEALSSQAAVASDNQMLIAAQRELLESFIKLIASAIDAKSPYTGGHCQRVPVITEMLADAACEAEDGPYKEFSLTAEEKYELSIAAWLHDCGKVTTPEYVVDKATKLETIYDRVDTVRVRFEVARRDAEIDYLRALQGDEVDAAALKADYEARMARLEDDQAFLEVANIGGEFMSEDHQARIHEIAAMTWENNGNTEPFLSENEVYNLCIARGTLTAEEREVINNHIVMTVEMLEQLPFPKHLRKVPEYAGGHHEKMDGTGYPKGLTADEMSLPARMMAIADIFEALTASDRPYKKAKTVSESLKIMGFMVKDAHIDPDLFRLFLQADIPRAYAEANLLPDQVDSWDAADYLG